MDSTVRKGIWEITLDNAITTVNPVFLVKTSRTEFVLGNTVIGDIKGDAVSGYFCYSSITGNFELEGYIRGFSRGSDNLRPSGSSVDVIPNASFPLYLLSKQRDIKCIYQGIGAGTQMIDGKWLYFRNLIAGTYLKVNLNGCTYHWDRFTSTSDPVYISNHPTLIPYEGPDGGYSQEPRLYNPEADSNGFTSTEGVSIYVDGQTLNLPYNYYLNNMKLNF